MQGEELTDRFLRILTDLAVTHCLTGESSTMTMRPGLLYFVAVDAYVRLLTMLITGHARPLFLAFIHAPPCHTMSCTSVSPATAVLVAACTLPFHFADLSRLTKQCGAAQPATVC